MNKERIKEYAILEREDGTRIRVALLANMTNKPTEPDLIPDDWVYVWDDERSAVPVPTQLVSISDDSFPYTVRFPRGGQVAYRHAQPVTDRPGILLRYRGGGCPVDRDLIVTTFWVNEETGWVISNSGVAKTLSWGPHVTCYLVHQG